MVCFRVAFPSLKAAVTDCFHQRFNIFTFPFVAADLHFVFLLFLQVSNNRSCGFMDYH